MTSFRTQRIKTLTSLLTRWDTVLSKSICCNHPSTQEQVWPSSYAMHLLRTTCTDFDFWICGPRENRGRSPSTSTHPNLTLTFNGIISWWNNRLDGRSTLTFHRIITDGWSWNNTVLSNILKLRHPNNLTSTCNIINYSPIVLPFEQISRHLVQSNCNISIAHSERQLQILTAPNLHARVVLADMFKVTFIDSKQSTSHRRTLWTSIYANNFSLQTISRYF